MFCIEVAYVSTRCLFLVARRVVENKVHMFDGKKFLLKFPVQKSESVVEDDEHSSASNVEPENIVEIHGDIRGLGMESLQMYLENTNRSGGGMIEKVDWDATPPRVVFRDAEGKLCIMYLGM